MRTGFYVLADELLCNSQEAIEDEGCLAKVYGTPEDLLIEPVTYLHGSCHVLARYLALEYGYNIRAYHAVRPGCQDLLVHAVCFEGEPDGDALWIDVRGVTDDMNEMLEPFADDIVGLEKRGYAVVSTDFCGIQSVDDFEDEFVGANCDLDAFDNEIANLLWLSGEAMYKCL